MQYRIESKASTGVFDPDTGSDVTTDVILTFTVTFSRGRMEDGVLVASTYIRNVQKERRSPNQAPRSSNGWSYENLEYRSLFADDGKFLSIEPVTKGNKVIAMEVEQFANILKLVFSSYDSTGRGTPGKHTKTIQIDSTTLVDMTTVTKMFVDRVWRGVIDTLGGRYDVINFVADSSQRSGNSFLANADSDMSPKSTFGTIAYFPETSRPYFIFKKSRSETDLLAIMEKNKGGSKKKKEVSSDRKKEGVIIVETRIQAQLIR